MSTQNTQVTTRIFSGSIRVAAIPVHDRGFAYGDGLFETMRVHRGTLPWWDAHWTRLSEGAKRLQLRLPQREQVVSEAAKLFDDGGDGVLKLVVSRGIGARGYAVPADNEPTWVLLRHRLPPPVAESGMVLRWCRTRLALQPLLAGLKHCNRLEQVLARHEWHDPAAVDTDAGEGLLCDTQDSVVSATTANLFVLREGRWLTPILDRCGVAGVCRAWLLPELDARETRLSIEDVESADAVVLCNAVRGILGVARLGARAWPPHPAVAAARRRLALAHPGFANELETS